MPQNKNRPPRFQDYLNREDRMGLDPLDNRRTEASIEGWFLRRLFTFSLRTRSTFKLIMMLLSGLYVTAVMGVFCYGLIYTFIISKPKLRDCYPHILVSPLFFLTFFIGIALIINFIINLRIVLGYGNGEADDKQQDRPKEVKKKLPKRRKDYK